MSETGSRKGVWYGVIGLLALVGAVFVNSYIDKLVGLMSEGFVQDSALAIAALLPLAALLFLACLCFYKALYSASPETKNSIEENYAATEQLPVDSTPITNYEPRAQIQWLVVGDAPGVEFRAGLGMTARKIASDDELARDIITDRAVPLARIVNPSGELNGKTFIRCSIIGPAIILPVERRPFDDCLWDAHPSEREIIFTPRQTKPYGVVSSRGTFFRQCQFLQVAFMLLPDEIETIWNTSGLPKP